MAASVRGSQAYTSILVRLGPCLIKISCLAVGIALGVLEYIATLESCGVVKQDWPNPLRHVYIAILECLCSVFQIPFCDLLADPHSRKPLIVESRYSS